MSKDKIRKRSLGKKTLASMIIYALLLTVAVSVPVSCGFSALSQRHYKEDTQDYAGIVAHVIQGDKIAGYLESGEKDEYYYNTDVFLTALRDELDLTDLSVLVPAENEIIYIWDTPGAEGDSDLGDRTKAFLDYMKYVQDRISSESIKSLLVRTHNGKDLFLSAFAPIYDSQDKTVAFVCVTRPSMKMGTIISQFILAIFLASALVSAVMMHIIYRLMKKRFLGPIAKLTESAEAMVDNIERDRDVAIDVHTNDEFETLAEAFTKMDIDLRDYVRELSVFTAEKERASAELSVASQIQGDMLPRLKPPMSEMKEFDLFASMTPAKQVGGDFYDFFMVDDSHIALVMADVSDKGVPAALFMVVSKTLIKSSLKAGMSPAEALCNVNEKLLENNDAGYFVTVWVAVIDLETGKGKAVNAGHEHPAVRLTGCDYELIKYKHSPAVAVLPGVKFAENEFRMEPGEALFVYTDGVTDAADTEGKQFGEDRLIDTLNSHIDDKSEELTLTVKETIDEFVGDAPQFDDITMLAFRYNGR